VQDAWPAFLASCRALRFQSQWTQACTAAQVLTAPSSDAVRSFFRQYFDPYRVLNPNGYGGRDLGLVTGYYEPLLYGSRTPSARFSAPVYATPSDLLIVDLASLYPELKGKRIRGRLDGNRVVPYYSRAELPTDPAIRGKEIVYIDGPLDAFMLQVQGSGRVQLPSGETIRLQYADQNGHPFRSIGRYLVDREREVARLRRTVGAPWRGVARLRFRRGLARVGSKRRDWPVLARDQDVTGTPVLCTVPPAVAIAPTEARDFREPRFMFNVHAGSRTRETDSRLLHRGMASSQWCSLTILTVELCTHLPICLIHNMNGID